MAALLIKDFNVSSSFDSKELSPEELRVQEELEIELPHCISPTTFCALAALASLLKPTYLWVLYCCCSDSLNIKLFQLFSVSVNLLFKGSF